MRPLVVLLTACVLFLKAIPSSSVSLVINPEFALVGETVTVTCTLKEDKTFEYARLYHESTPVLSALYPPNGNPPDPVIRESFADEVLSKEVMRNGIRFSFKSKLSHNGKYSCKFFAGINDETSDSVSATVGYPAEVKSFDAKPKEILRGKRATLTCIGNLGLPNGNLEVQDVATKDILEGTRTFIRDADGNKLQKLTITVTGPTDKKTIKYACSVKNIFNEKRQNSEIPVQKVTVLVIYHPPSYLRILPKKEEYQDGEKVTCTANAYPSASIKWFTNDTSDIIETKGKDLVLKLKQNMTRVTCVAQNEILGSIFSERKIIWFTGEKDGFLRHDKNIITTTTETPTTTMAAPTTTATTSTITATTITTTATTEAPTATTVTTTTKAPTTAPTTPVPMTQTTTEETAATSTSTQTTRASRTTAGRSGSTNGRGKDRTSSKDKDDEDRKGTTRKHSERPTVRPGSRNGKRDGSLVNRERYDRLLYFLKISILVNVVLGVTILIFVIGLCIRLPKSS